MKYADGEIILDAERNPSAPYIEGPDETFWPQIDIRGLKSGGSGCPTSDFAQCVRNRQKFALNETNGHRSATLVNLGKIAVRLGRTLHFDPLKQQFINDEAANRLINQPMRAPWHL
jgi:hypothetical protein